MKISYNWLKNYINIDKPAEEVSEVLTNIGLEVEGLEKFESIKGGLEGLVIGKVLTCEKHPNADKLSVTTVDINAGDPLPIVCGAPNVAAGQKVVVATVGTILYAGKEEFKIKKAKIRGEVSQGMICAEDEIGLSDNHEGIIVIPDEVEIGTPAKDYYKIENDYVFEIGLTPNRIDAGSHYGVARDLAAYYNMFDEIELIKPDVSDFEPDEKSNDITVEVENHKACPRYAGITISNLTVKESPEWLQNYLKAIGSVPINNVVDITNYILHELGQPLHAFDASKITGNKVIVKTLKDGTKFTTLDEAERKLSSEDLMICNSEGGMCIGGVFGGIDSGVQKSTTSIFLESAYFDPVWIRKTAKRHTLSTDASFRFERGIDPNITIYALKRAALLMKEIAGGKITSDIIDLYPEEIENTIVHFDYSYADRLIGKKLDRGTIKCILSGLEMKIVNEDEHSIDLEVPAYRVDVQRPADIVEEILRIYGYNNIEIPESLHSTITIKEKPDFEKLQNSVSDYLSDNGFSEIMSNSLTKSAYYEDNDLFEPEKLVKIMNPLSSDLNCMRQSLLFGGLEAINYNQNRQVSDLKIYEFGNCYFMEESKNGDEPLNKYQQVKHLALFITGNKTVDNWVYPKPEKTTFHYLKAFIEGTLIKLGYKVDEIEYEELSNEHFELGLSLKLKNKHIGEFGILNKGLLNRFDIESDVFYGYFKWNDLVILNKDRTITYKPLAKFPWVRRDLALLLDEAVQFKQLKDIAFSTEKKILKKVSLFDYYKGKNIGEGKKSYGVSFILQDENKTLNDKQIDKIMSKLQKNYEKELNAQIR